MSEVKSAEGLLIEDISVEGSEFDVDQNRISADTVIEASNASRWFLSIVTSGHFRDEEISGAFREIEDPATHLAAIGEGFNRRTPYVINDRSITDDILRKNFIGLEVGEYLASIMVYREPDTE